MCSWKYGQVLLLSIKYDYLETAGILVDDAIINAFDSVNRKVYKKYMDNIKCTDIFQKERELSDKLLPYFTTTYFESYAFDRKVEESKITVDHTLFNMLTKKINTWSHESLYTGINHIITKYKVKQKHSDRVKIMNCF